MEVLSELLLDGVAELGSNIMFGELLFDSSTMSTWQIYKLLTSLSPQRHSLQSVAKTANLSYARLYKAVKEIDEMLQSQGLIEHSLIVPNNGIRTDELHTTNDEFLHL